MSGTTKVRLARDGAMRKLLWWCSGCETPHGVTIAESGTNGWAWNGSLEAPTLSPSILVQGTRGGAHEQPPTPPRDHVCHSFLREGRQQFLADCTHPLAGQTVELEPWW